jgi:hypothetical protein
MKNRISATLSPESVEKILQKLREIRAELPFLVDLSPEERQSLPKMGDNRRAMVIEALNVAEQNDSYLPRSFDVPELRQDVELVMAMSPIVVALTQLVELVQDTDMLVGSEAYAGALVVYKSAKDNGEGEALDNLVDSLGKSFARKSKGKPAPYTDAKPSGEDDNK